MVLGGELSTKCKKSYQIMGAKEKTILQITL
jgi:hypothetical protein